MNRHLCPECGMVPHYHSFCTRCAKLFHLPKRHLEFYRKLQIKERKVVRRAKLDERFREAYFAAGTIEGVMAQLGHCRAHVLLRIKELGLPSFPHIPISRPRKPWTAEADAALTAAVAEGLTQKETAERIGVTIYLCRARAQVLQLERPPPRCRRSGSKVPQLVAKIDRLRRAGLSFSEVAAKVGVSRSAAIGQAHRHLSPRFPNDCHLPHMRSPDRAARIESLPEYSQGHTQRRACETVAAAGRAAEHPDQARAQKRHGQDHHT